jgi:hypothetical protein
MLLHTLVTGRPATSPEKILLSIIQVNPYPTAVISLEVPLQGAHPVLLRHAGEDPSHLLNTKSLSYSYFYFKKRLDLWSHRHDLANHAAARAQRRFTAAVSVHSFAACSNISLWCWVTICSTTAASAAFRSSCWRTTAAAQAQAQRTNGPAAGKACLTPIASVQARLPLDSYPRHLSVAVESA